MNKNIYEEVRAQLFRLFDLVELVKSQEVIIESILGEEYNNICNSNEKIDYCSIGKRLVEYIKKRDNNDLTEPDLHIIMLAKISDIIKAAVELETAEKAEFIDLSGDVINVDEKLEYIFFDVKDDNDLNEKVNEFIEFHIDRLMYQGMNEFINHDFNIEDWVILGENKIGLYLDSSVYHHYGCWIPKKFFDHLSLPIDLSLSDEIRLQLFFKKKAYTGTLRVEEGKYMLYWGSLLRRRINKKYPHVISYKENFVAKQRVLMSFYYHENFENNFLKIDFELVDI